MRLVMRARIVVLMIAVLALGPALSLASPMMDAGHDSTSTMAMAGSGAPSAQADCVGCTDMEMAKTIMGAHCNIVCLSPVMLPADVAIAEQKAQPQWAIPPAEDRLGITTSIDPYPPNLFS